jgi:hypothetical protein
MGIRRYAPAQCWAGSCNPPETSYPSCTRPAPHASHLHTRARAARRRSCNSSAHLCALPCALAPSHTPSDAPAPAHCALARRAQMCLRQGHPGSRGSSDPLYACGAEYHAGIFDEQVRPPFPCTPLASPAPPRPHTNPDRADPPLSTAAALVPRNFCMGAKLLARRAALHFVLLCRMRVVTSKRMRCVQLCECSRAATCVSLVRCPVQAAVCTLPSLICDLRFYHYLNSLNV